MEDELERRFNLRKKLRRILNSVQEGKSFLLEDVKDNNAKFREICAKVRELCLDENGDHVRELHLDSAIARELTNILNEKSIALNEFSKSYNFQRFLQGARRVTESAPSSIDWTEMGRRVAMPWRMCESLTTMCGPLKKQEKEREKKQKIARPLNNESDDEKLPQKAVSINTEIDIQEDEKQNKRVATLLHHLENLQDSDLRVLLDPRDPLQTIENFFDFSFLIKNAKAEMYMDNKTNLPKIQLVDSSKMSNEKKQMILSLTAKDLQDLCDVAFGEKTENQPLHRDDELYKLTVYQQTQPSAQKQANSSKSAKKQRL